MMMKHILILMMIMAVIVIPAFAEEENTTADSPAWLPSLVQGMQAGMQAVHDKQMDDKEFAKWMIIQMSGIIGGIIQYYGIE